MDVAAIVEEAYRNTSIGLNSESMVKKVHQVIHNLLLDKLYS